MCFFIFLSITPHIWMQRKLLCYCVVNSECHLYEIESASKLLSVCFSWRSQCQLCQLKISRIIKTELGMSKSASLPSKLVTELRQCLSSPCRYEDFPPSRFSVKARSLRTTKEAALVQTSSRGLWIFFLTMPLLLNCWRSVHGSKILMMSKHINMTF